MSKQTENSRFILSPFKIKQAGFYQDLLKGVVSYQQLGNRLIHLAEQSYALRQASQLQEIAQTLIHLPIKTYQTIGWYYLAMGLTCCKDDLRRAEKLLTTVADTAPEHYRAKAILSLAAISAYTRDYDSELYYYIETLKASKDVVVNLNTYRGIAIYKAKEGSHKQALEDIERALPLARFAPPHTYFDFLNSYAVELGEVGRTTEARNIARAVLASPFAPVYPEWQQTAADLQAPSRSMVQVVGPRAESVSPDNVLSMTPAPERVVESPPTQPAKVFNLAEWKEKMVKEPNDEPDENLDAMGGKDLLLKLLQLTTKEDIDEAYLRKIVKYAVKLATGKNKTDKQ